MQHVQPQADVNGRADRASKQRMEGAGKRAFRCVGRSIATPRAQLDVRTRLAVRGRANARFGGNSAAFSSHEEPRLGCTRGFPSHVCTCFHSSQGTLLLRLHSSCNARSIRTCLPSSRPSTRFLFLSHPPPHVRLRIPPRRVRPRVHPSHATRMRCEPRRWLRATLRPRQTKENPTARIYRPCVSTRHTPPPDAPLVVPPSSWGVREGVSGSVEEGCARERTLDPTVVVVVVVVATMENFGAKLRAKLEKLRANRERGTYLLANDRERLPEEEEEHGVVRGESAGIGRYTPPTRQEEREKMQDTTYEVRWRKKKDTKRTRTNGRRGGEKKTRNRSVPKPDVLTDAVPKPGTGSGQSQHHTDGRDTRRNAQCG